MKYLKTVLAGVELNSPLIGAAGTVGTLDELQDVNGFVGLGAVTTKSITAEPRDGHPPWRLVEAKVGMLNAIGLANPGIEKFIESYAPRISSLPIKTFGSIAGHSIEEYVRVAKQFELLLEVPVVEVNVSCPNTADGRSFVEDSSLLQELLRSIREVLVTTKLSVKLPPDSASPVDLASIAINSGADMLVIANTFPAMAIDPFTRRPRLSAGSGGLSGPGTHPIVVRLVNLVYKEVARSSQIPIIALGGVFDWEDAAEFILAGASAVAIGTGLIVNPRCAKKISKGLDKWVHSQGVSGIQELTGELIS